MTPKSPLKLMIFDFDGVIVDSFNAAYAAVSESFEVFGINLNQKEYRDFFMQNPKQAEKNLIPDQNKFKDLQVEINKRVAIYMAKAKIFPGAQEMIKKIHKLMPTAIISSSSEEAIVNKLKQNDLFSEFDLILSSSHELSKIQKFSKTIQHFNVLPAQTGFISDTYGDCVEAKKFGFVTFAVLWGFHDEKILKTAGADFYLSRFEDLNSIISV